MAEEADAGICSWEEAQMLESAVGRKRRCWNLQLEGSTDAESCR